MSFTKGFPDMTDAEWDRLFRSHTENLRGRQLTDEEWDAARAMGELAAARCADNYAGNKSTHYLETDESGCRIFAPVEESAHYYNLKFWVVSGRYGPYLHVWRRKST